VEKNLTKSTLDIETELSSEEEIEPEIDDESLNRDEEEIHFDESDPYNEPEYETVDDSVETKKE